MMMQLKIPTGSDIILEKLDTGVNIDSRGFNWQPNICYIWENINKSNNILVYFPYGKNNMGIRKPSENYQEKPIWSLYSTTTNLKVADNTPAHKKGSLSDFKKV